MRKIALAALLAVSAGLGSCVVGPHQLGRTVDDWDRKMYVESPWLDAALNIIPVVPIAKFGAGIADFFVTDAYTFWLKDAFAGKGGTGFVHYQDTSSRQMKSLLADGKFLEISGEKM
ncbi:MAG: hypothetical protein KDC95_17050 [Planctomycetes bacterium]|nr:hypothetical protein [Planctomycetota bacterium]